MSDPVVFIIYEDAAARASFAFLLETHGWTVRDFRTQSDFLAAYEPGRKGCLLLTEKMPKTSGLECLAALRQLGIGLPAILTVETVTSRVRHRAVGLGAVVVEDLSIEMLTAAIESALVAEPGHNRPELNASRCSEHSLFAAPSCAGVQSPQSSRVTHRPAE